MIEDLFTPMHLLVIFAILFFLFGAKRLPGLGKSLGHGIREFRGGIAGLSDADGDEELSAATPAEPLAIAAPAAVVEGETLDSADDETVADGGEETVVADQEPVSVSADGESEQRAS